MQPRPAGGVYGNRVRIMSDQERYFGLDRPLQDVSFADSTGHISSHQSSVSKYLPYLAIKSWMNHIRSPVKLSVRWINQMTLFPIYIYWVLGFSFPHISKSCLGKVYMISGFRSRHNFSVIF